MHTQLLRLCGQQWINIGLGVGMLVKTVASVLPIWVQKNGFLHPLNPIVVVVPFDTAVKNGYHCILREADVEGPSG